MLFDAHCHLTDARFAGDLDAVVERAQTAGVQRMTTIASNLEDAGAALALANRFPGRVWCTAGQHPHDAAAAPPDLAERLREACSRPGVVAVGETGLDYHYDHSPRDVQRRVLDTHLALALELDLPIVLHCRDADEDAIAAIGGAGVRGVLHCFAGGAPLLEAGLQAGWFVSFAGLVSFGNYDGADLVRAVPADRLLIETDSPYLAPVPHRGRRNEPAYVARVADAVAAIRGETAEEVARMTWHNANRFYALA